MTDKVIKISNFSEPKILSNEIDESSMKIFDKSKSLFSEWNITDYKNFFAHQRDEIAKKILASNLIEKVKVSAEESITNLILMNPQTSSYKVEFTKFVVKPSAEPQAEQIKLEPAKPENAKLEEMKTEEVNKAEAEKIENNKEKANKLMMI